MRRLTCYTLTATADGTGAGTATTITDQSIPMGKIYAVEVDYPVATVALTLTTKNLAATQTVLNLGAANTDVMYYPRVPVCVNTGAETVLYSAGNKVCEQYVVFGALTLTLASGTSGQSVTVKVYVEEY